jgi:hypothetical protein
VTAGLVLGHRVLMGAVAGPVEPFEWTFRGRITSLDPVTVWLDRIRWSDAFQPGDAVRVAMLVTDREPMDATVVEAARGTLRLRLLSENGDWL